MLETNLVDVQSWIFGIDIKCKRFYNSLLTLNINTSLSLREKCQNTVLFLVRIFLFGLEITPYLDTFHAVFWGYSITVQVKLQDMKVSSNH